MLKTRMDQEENNPDEEEKEKATGDGGEISAVGAVGVPLNTSINYQKEIEDFTEKDLVQLRKTIYLIIMSAMQYEECCHKLLKLQIRPGQEIELCSMVIECCMQDRTYLPFYGHIG